MRGGAVSCGTLRSVGSCSFGGLDAVREGLPIMQATAYYLHMSDIMTRNPVCATPGMTVRQLATIFAERKISGAPVVDAQGTLVGVVSRTDLFRRITERTSESAGGDQQGGTAGFLFDLISDQVPAERQVMPEALLAVADFMCESVITARPDENIGIVARRIAQARVHRVVVIDEARKPIGVVTALDFLKVFPTPNE
jgi:CBS domain-containing protein